MRISVIVLAASVFAASLIAEPVVAAGAPVATVYTSLQSAIGKNVRMQDVEKAFKECSADRGWNFQRISSGKLIGKLYVRGKHYVEVEVQFNSKEYTITYRDSKNMKYDSEKQTIHRRYNSWVENLDNDVKFCLK